MGCWRNNVLALVFAPILLLAGCALSQSGEKAAGDASPLPVVGLADAQRRADIRLQLALDYYELAQFSVAVEQANLALQARPDLLDAYSVRALAYVALKQSGLAERDFRRTLELAPDNPDLANNYGWFLCGDAVEHRGDEAIRYLEQAAEHQSYGSPAKALNNAGRCSLKLGNAAAAERYFVRALQFESTSASAHLNLSKLYFDRAEFEKARRHISLAAKNDILTEDALWLAIRIERKLGNQAAENDLAVQLRRRYPSSSEYAAYQRGAFDE